MKTCRCCKKLCDKILKEIKQEKKIKVLICPICKSKECVWYLGLSRLQYAKRHYVGGWVHSVSRRASWGVWLLDRWWWI